MFNDVWATPIIFETIGFLNTRFGSGSSLLHDLEVSQMPKNWHYVMDRIRDSKMDKVSGNYNYIITKKYDDLIRCFVDSFFDEARIVNTGEQALNKLHSVFGIEYPDLKIATVVTLMMTISHGLSHNVNISDYYNAYADGTPNVTNVIQPSILILGSNIPDYLGDYPKTVKLFQEKLDEITEFCEQDIEKYVAAHPRYMSHGIDI